MSHWITDPPWITDRPPTEADGDRDGDVAVKQRPASDSFAYLNWTFVKPGMAWRRTNYWSASQPAAPQPSASATQPRRFASISRTILKDGDHILDAIDDEGIAWWSRLDTSPCFPGFESSATTWQRLSPLPSREFPTEAPF